MTQPLVPDDQQTVQTPQQRTEKPAVRESDVQQLAGSLRGRLLRPGEDGYDDARAIWNGMIDRRPDLIAQPIDAADISKVVTFAREHGQVLAVRAGDHNVAGNAVPDGGIMLDLASMKGITVDPATRTARVEPGVRWGELDAATQREGLAVTGGSVADTGVAGLTLGGGFGWLGGRYGLTCDNLISADVVTADGALLKASESENADLFWGLRGGGGNFGVVSAFDFQLHPVGPTITGGMVVHPLERAKEVLAFYREFVDSAPDEVNTQCAILTTPDGMKVMALAACHCGSEEDGARALAPLKEFGPPLVDQIGPVPYVDLQQALEPMFPRGRRYYWKSHMVPAIPDEMIERVVEHYLVVPSPTTACLFQELGNAANRVPADATAFPHRKARWDAVTLGGWDDPAQDAENIAWVRSLYEAERPFGIGTYANIVPDPDAEAIAAAYGDRYEKLAALKAKYDPTNLFRMNANIPPQAG